MAQCFNIEVCGIASFYNTFDSSLESSEKRAASAPAPAAAPMLTPAAMDIPFFGSIFALV
jgi:hypothetical protein